MLGNIKMLLGIPADDTGRDELINLLISRATARLKILLGGIEPPADLEYIICDVACIRFNRIGSEGMSGHTVEGESLTFTENDFSGFADDIQAFLDSRENGKRGRLRFL